MAQRHDAGADDDGTALAQVSIGDHPADDRREIGAGGVGAVDE
jgi:hypothetical protein